MVNMAVSCPHTFSIGTIILTIGGKKTTPPRPKIYPQNLSTQYLVVWCSKKQQRREVGLFKFHKKRNFFMSLCYVAPVR